MMMYEGFKKSWGKAWLGNGWTLIGLTAGLCASLHFAVPDLFSVAFFPFILLSAAYGSLGIDRFFAAKPLQRLGDLSFSIYLVHEPVMYSIWKIMDYRSLQDGPSLPPGPPSVPPLMTSWLICFGIILLSIGLAFLSYRFIEVPMRLWINAKK